MCGIVGMLPKRSNGFFRTDLDLFQKLLVLDGEFRGLDSTGAFQVQNNRQAYLVKSATVPHILFKTSQWGKFENRMTASSRLVIGHNRKATVGESTSHNAHPFQEGHIILVHNGTLHNHRDFAEATVDSHAITKAFNEKGAEEVLPKIRGAFVFVWYDMQKERLFIVRNDERPLGFIETNNMIYFASEPWMVEVLRRRMNSTEEGKLTEIPVGKLYEFNPFDGKYTSKDIELYKVGGQSHHFLGGKATQVTTVHGGNRVTPPVTGGTTSGVSSIPGMNEIDEDACNLDVSDCYPKSDGKVINLYPEIHNSFAKDEDILIRVLSADRKGSSDQWAIRGVVTHPAKPLADIAGTLYNVKPEQLSNYVGQIVEARVDYITKHTAGPVVHVKNIDEALHVNMWGGLIPMSEWDYVAENCQCNVCKAKLNFNEANVTYIKRTKMGADTAYYVECPDCVEKRVENNNIEGVLNAFKQRRDSTVQDGKSKRVGAGKGTNAIVPVSGPATLQ